MIALAVGMVPCPGVVLVMLFCISMGMTLLGVMLSCCVALGMAATLTLVILTGRFGRESMSRFSISKRAWAVRVESLVETIGAMVIFGLGALLFFSVS